MFRAKVTAVTTAGIYVLCADVAPTSIGPCQAVAAPYVVGDEVLVVDVGDDGSPDLVVIGKVSAGGGQITSTDNAVARFDGTTGALQNSGVTIDDSGGLTAGGGVGSRPASGDANLSASSMDGNTGSYLVGIAGKWQSVYFCTNVAGDRQYRWALGSTAEAESGSHAGSNFYIARWGDGWTNLGYAVTISRSSGKVTIGAAGTTAGLELGSSGPTITTGTGAPGHSPPNGSLYIRTDGTASTTLYVRAGGAWAALS